VLKTRSLFYRIMLIVPVVLSIFMGTISCGTKVSAFSPLTVLSIVQGNVLIQKAGSSDWNTGKEGTTLQAGDKIKTDTGATATITFFDGSTIDLNSGTEISLDELLSKTSTTPKTIKIGQTIGETGSNIIKLVDPASRYEIDTQSGVAAVRGSKMVVQVVADGTTSVYNVEGTISFTAQGQEVMIPIGSVSTAKPGASPSAPQPGTPPAIGGSGVTSIFSLQGWQLTGLYLNAGDKFYVDYRGGSWSVNIHGYGYVGPNGISMELDKKVDPSSKIALSVPYGYLIGKVGSGNIILIGNKGGPFTADVSGFLSLRMNDGDKTLADNDGAISVNLRGPATKPNTATLPIASTSGFSLDKSPILQGKTFNAVWGNSPSDVFVAGYDNQSFHGIILQYDGKTWGTMTIGTTNELQGIWGSSSSNIYVVGLEGVMLHYDGNAWTNLTSDTSYALTSIWGSSAQDIFAVGHSYRGALGIILHYDGRAWSNMTSNTTNDLLSVWGSSPSDVFAVGVAGTILHYDGNRWSSMTSGTTSILQGIWGSSSSNVFSVGNASIGTGNIILHYDGKVWSSMNSGTIYGLWGVWGSSPSDVFAVGNGNSILHYDGNAWSTMNSGTYNGLIAVWGSSSSNVYAVGAAGSIVYYKP